MDSTNILKETTRVTAPVASSTLSVNVFTAPGKARVDERPKPFGRSGRRPGAIDTRKLSTATLKTQRAFLRNLCINIGALGGLRLKRSAAIHRLWLQLGRGGRR
jgi:hypothetical protein